MCRAKSIAIRIEFHGSIKVFSLSNWSVDIVFWVHDLKVILKLRMSEFSWISFRRIWINWLSSVPIVSFKKIKRLKEKLNLKLTLLYFRKSYNLWRHSMVFYINICIDQCIIVIRISCQRIVCNEYGNNGCFYYPPPKIDCSMLVRICF